MAALVPAVKGATIGSIHATSLGTHHFLQRQKCDNFLLFQKKIFLTACGKTLTSGWMKYSTFLVFLFLSCAVPSLFSCTDKLSICLVYTDEI
jgi:hypothetical protein